MDGMRQRKYVCRNAKREALDPRHARLPNLTLRDRAGSAVVHLTTTPCLVPSHPSPRVKSHHSVLVRTPRTSTILQLADLDVLPRQESFASLHILTRRASEGSEALPSLARRVSMSFFGARVISVPERKPQKVSPRQTHAHFAATS